MLYFKKNQSNNIVVTWTERAQSDAAPFYLLVLTNLTSLQDTLIVLPKVSNLSNFTERYDKFQVLTQFTQGGQYKYVAYESNTTALSGAIGVVETGLAQVETDQAAFISDSGVTQYVAFDTIEPSVNPAPAPTIETAAGIYAGFANIVITSLVSGTIYYTTDGTTPSSQNGTLYTGAFNITSTTLIQARQYVDGFTLGEVANAFYTINPITLTATPDTGTYLIGTLDPIVLETDSEGATIYYTTDGSTPTEASTEYTEAITPFDVITTLKARAFNSPASPSEVLTEVYSIQALAPTVSPASGTFVNEQLVCFSNPNPQGQVFVSLNGGAFQDITDECVILEEITTYVAEVRSEAYVTSAQVSGTISIQCAAVTFSPNGGEFESTTGEITLSTTTPDAAIRYTTDGSEPTESSTLYNPLAKPALTSTATMKAKAFKANLLASETSQAVFTVLLKLFLVGNAGSGTQRLYQSINNGAAWTEVQPFGNESRIYNDSQISDTAASVLIVEGASAQNIRISKDTLQTWQTPTFPSALVSSVIFRGTSNGGVFIACANIGNSRNQILVSTDGGLNFVDRSPSLATFNGCEISPDGSTMYAFKSSVSNLDNVVIYRSTDLGLNWVAVYTLAHIRISFASCSDAAVYFNAVTQADGFWGTFRLAHTSLSVVDLSTAIGSQPISAIQRAISVSNNDDVLIFWNTSNTTTRRSTNQGASFSTVLLTANNARRMNINGAGTKVITGHTGSVINISLDGGQTYATPAATPGSGSRTWQLADVN